MVYIPLDKSLTYAKFLLQEGGGEPPKGSLGSTIDTNFGSLEALIQKMNAEGAAVQGSGWVVSNLAG